MRFPSRLELVRQLQTRTGSGRARPGPRRARCTTMGAGRILPFPASPDPSE